MNRKTKFMHPHPPMAIFSIHLRDLEFIELIIKQRREIQADQNGITLV